MPQAQAPAGKPSSVQTEQRAPCYPHLGFGPTPPQASLAERSMKYLAVTKTCFSDKSKNKETCRQGKRAKPAPEKGSLEMLACKFDSKTQRKVTRRSMSRGQAGHTTKSFKKFSLSLKCYKIEIKAAGKSIKLISLGECTTAMTYSMPAAGPRSSPCCSAEPDIPINSRV